MSLDLLDKIEQQHTQAQTLKHVLNLGITLLLMYQATHLADYVWRLLGCPC